MSNNSTPRDYVVFFRLQRTATGPTLEDPIEVIETSAYEANEAWFQAAFMLDAKLGGVDRMGLEAKLLLVGPNDLTTHLRARALASLAALAGVEPRSVA